MAAEEQKIVLIVDDVPENITVLKDILNKNYRIKIALDGEKALELTRQEPHPDLILLDIMMPGMSGYEVCKELKKDYSTSEIPVLFVTAMDKVQDEIKGLDLGAVDYITKPIVPELVLARVKTHIELKTTKEKLWKYTQKLEGMIGGGLDL